MFKNLLSLLLSLSGIYCCAGECWDLSAVNPIKAKTLNTTLTHDKNQFKVRAASFYMAMPDKTELFTMIAAPVNMTENDKYPIVFIRTPYAKAGNTNLMNFCKSQISYLRQGYAVVYQHCRGTGASGGDFIPYINERADGLETLRQIRLLPFYNAEIFLTGNSYLATVHYSYLDAAPDDIKGAVLLVQAIDRYHFRFHNNILRANSAGWHFINFNMRSLGKKNYKLNMFRMLPLADLTKEVFGESVPVIDNMHKSSDPDDEYWQTETGGAGFKQALSNYNFPILFVGGLYDIYTGENFKMWNSLAPEQRQISSMIMTPYDHSPPTGFRAKHHPIDFENGSLDKIWKNFRCDFFEYCRNRNKKPEFITPGNITYYALWEKKWYTEPTLADGPQKLTLFLGDRTLQNQSGKGEISYTYDPQKPAVFPAGCNFSQGGMKEQPPANFRKDVISFVSEKFTGNIKVRGKMSARIYVKSDREDTTFYLRLNIVKGDKTYCLREDIMPISKQHSNYKAGSTVPLDFSFIEHAFTVEKGDRLRLDISSSCWPNFVPHTNLPGDRFYHTSSKVANNTVVLENSSITLNTQP